MRINVDLDQLSSEKFRFIQQATGDSTVDILQDALDLFYQQVLSQQANPFQILEKTGFIGSGQGTSDVSEKAKSYLDFGKNPVDPTPESS